MTRAINNQPSSVDFTLHWQKDASGNALNQHGKKMAARARQKYPYS
tara:strand:+ start:253 stop:390 length:138 start_codon:yes stop_codon:yes gene_type:complete